MIRRIVIVTGIVGNLIMATYMIMFAIRYRSWEMETLSPTVELSVDHKFNHILYSELFPAVAVMGVASAGIIWRIRKI
jgi:hypothetical protein